MKGYNVKERTENFVAFESTRNMTYDMKEFFSLCESMLRKGYEYIGDYEGNVIFKRLKKTSQKKEMAK